MGKTKLYTLVSGVLLVLMTGPVNAGRHPEQIIVAGDSTAHGAYCSFMPTDYLQSYLSEDSYWSKATAVNLAIPGSTAAAWDRGGDPDLCVQYWSKVAVTWKSASSRDAMILRMCIRQQGLKKEVRRAIGQKPEVVIFMGGFNDAFLLHATAQETADAIVGIYDYFQNRRIKMLVATPLRTTTNNQKYLEELSTILRDRGVVAPELDFNDPNGPAVTLLGDGIHPDEAGCAAIGKAFYQAVTNSR